MKLITFNPKILKQYFDPKIRLACYSCKRYGKVSRCPPLIESVEYYSNLLPSFNSGALIIEKFEITSKNDWNKLSKKSSLIMQSEIIKLRDLLSLKGIISFGLTAGACKFCKKCSYPCVFPQKGLIPLEGTGINVINLAKMFGYNLYFPVTKNFYRIGMILYSI